MHSYAPAALASLFDSLGIPYRIVEHAPLLTVQDGIDRGVTELMGVPPEHLIKNLLLRNTRHELFLVVTFGDTRLDLKSLARTLGSTRLSFAPADVMRGMLGADPGCASMLALLDNPHAGEIRLVIDEAVPEVAGDVGFAAGANTRTALVPAHAVLPLAAALNSGTAPRMFAM